ncbi:MAG TPA: hypothetical protein ENH82_03240 [bacterium]|nr:hypothetical protein [bacterium]
MKRKDFIKTGLVTAGGLLLPVKSHVLENTARGKVIDTLSEEPVEGAVLKFYAYPDGNLINEYVTDSDGYYYPDMVGIETITWGEIKRAFKDNNFESLKSKADKQSSSWNKVVINHPDYYDAGRYVKSGELLDSDIIPLSFDMELFDGGCRPKGYTERWAEQPEWYVDISPTPNKNIEITQDKIDLVKEIINNDLIKFSRQIGGGSFINNPKITIGTNRPELGTERTINISWNDENVSGAHGERLDGKRIYYGSIYFSTNWFRRETYLHELTQVLGVRGEIQNYNFMENGQYTQHGLDSGKILYSRPIGSRSPDEDPIPSL